MHFPTVDIASVAQAVYDRAVKAARRFRRPVPSPALIAKAAKAEPPPRFPRGYFDPLMPVVRKLLDNGYRLYQVADWCVNNGTLKEAHRIRFMGAMRMRFSRLRQQDTRKVADVQWMTSMFYDSIHAVTPEGVALCGSRASQWSVFEGGGAAKCTRCQGIVTKKNVTIAGDN